ncbi:MAG TPA: hypothetical protein VME22_04785 [Solirubrobacteraceae bacterium]|nr:hypothetical protein [Solirubrobacteraceae bacterium]
MSSSSRYRFLLLGALCSIALLAAATAYAATSGSASNSATLTLSAKAQKSLANRHVTLRAQRPATRKKSSYALPESSGKWNFVNATGTLNFKGVLALAVGKRKFKINSVTFSRPAKGNGQVTVKLAGKKVKLFTITGRPHVKEAATSETLTGMTAKLAKPGATRLNKELGGSAFKTNQKFGSFAVTVTTSPITIATTSGSPTGSPTVTGGSSTGAGVDFVPAFRSLLDTAGLSTIPLVPASNGLPAPLGTTTIPGADGTGVTLPLAGGTAGATFDDGTLTGTIPLSGGLQLDNGQASASLTNPVLTLGTGTEGSALSFSVNGAPDVKLFDIDTDQLEQSLLPNGTIDLQNLLATLSSEGASTLNTALGTNAFTTGQPVGGLTLIVPASQG